MKNEYRLLLILATNIIVMAWISQRFILVSPESAPQGDCPQFAVICYNPGSNWETLRHGIDEAAAERGVAVEYIISAFSGSRADADSIQMAVESHADGIAVFQTSEGAGEAIDYARERGVPVVTMAYDEPGSAFDLFVGVESSIYSQRLLEILESAGADVSDIGLIYGKDIRPEFVEAIEGELEQRYRLWTVGRISSHIFDASETVEELFINSGGHLQVICCLDDNTTQGVAQAVVDWNMVNRLSIIGIGSAENVLPMVEKGFVSAAILTDYEQIGRDAVFALCDIYYGTPGAFSGGGDNLRVVFRETAAAAEDSDDAA